ncbi:MAG: hypothetical protein K2X69_09055 [Silvanigrellaceae bacterium]|nr:hypothetical protein [Silvanigrellaceae bacterium]
MASIEELRHRAWDLSSKSVKYINAINSIVYQNVVNKPEPIQPIKEEKINDYSLEYIEKLIFQANEKVNSLKQPLGIIKYINDKHNECIYKYNKFINK